MYLERIYRMTKEKILWLMLYTIFFLNNHSLFYYLFHIILFTIIHKSSASFISLTYILNIIRIIHILMSRTYLQIHIKTLKYYTLLRTYLNIKFGKFSFFISICLTRVKEMLVAKMFKTYYDF